MTDKSKVFWYDDKDLEKYRYVDSFNRLCLEAYWYALEHECVSYILSTNTGEILVTWG